MRSPFRFRLFWTGTALLAASAAAAPTKIVFWHSMEGVAGLVARYAEDFNKSQDAYEVVPVSIGNYREAEAKVLAALRAGNAPTLFQAELSFFPKLAADGRVVNLDKYENALPDGLVKDFYPGVWSAGEIGGKRFGLPWNVSLPALFYNASALKRAGLAAPKTYAELEAVAKRLSGRGKKGFVAVADAWTFEQIVAAQGGSVVANGKPNFTSPEVVAALEILARMVNEKTAVGRDLGEVAGTAIDFVRGVNSLVFASVANWTDFQKLSFLFELGAAPMPCAAKCAVPIGGAQLVVLDGANAQEQAGAVAFWRFLMEPARLQNWTESTFYLPPRKSVQPLLVDFLKQNPYRAAVFGQLDNAFSRPRVAGYAEWRGYLEEAIVQATKNGVPARQALQEAQRKAER